ncbi:hypothetical protein MICA_1223 [Micavibrio aeruginosavorus ARL-13]|uniref:Uncharacterized protein n=1 Tax=Micavibrio aeruginosavorus (strain ARL-13) TaxID=856793 RepID=G2KRI4_MICAA|nr:hypothetical protein MICA_1223 [Micavibrio aeruginosavorus ARL-13]
MLNAKHKNATGGAPYTGTPPVIYNPEYKNQAVFNQKTRFYRN